MKSIHWFGVIHWDLKPENFVFDENKKIKIIDFGTATLIKNDLNKEYLE